MMLKYDRLLNNPFDFSQAFNQALKNIVNALPNRKPAETAEETVKHSGSEASRTSADPVRCTTAHTLGASENIHAILEALRPHISTTWYRWRVL